MYGLTYGARAGPAHATAHTPSRDAGQHGDVGELGQAIINRLFSAGLNLNCALTLAVLGPSAGAAPDSGACDLRTRPR